MKLTALAERTESWWIVAVPAIPGLYTQARTFAGIPAMVKDAATLLTDEPEESFDVDVVQVDELP